MSNTTIYVDRPHRPATLADETINDARLSFRARGVLTWLLQQPHGTPVRREIIAENGPEGVTAIRSALQELTQFGYLHRVNRQGPEGKFQTQTFLSERPRLVEKPLVEKPPPVCPPTENPPAKLHISNSKEVITTSIGEASSPKKTRSSDPLFDALIEALGWVPENLTQTSRGPLNKALKDLREIGATPEEISEKCRRYRAAMPGMNLTPMALVKHWPFLDAPTPDPQARPQPGPVETYPELTPAQRMANVKRLQDLTRNVLKGVD